MNILTPHKPTYYDRSTSLDWTVSITRNGVCIFESDCTLTINYWPYDVAQVSMGDDFGYEIEALEFNTGEYATAIAIFPKMFRVTSDSDPALFHLLITELNKPSEAKKLKEAIAKKIAED